MSQAYVDKINEKTDSAGVTIESVKIEDGVISNVTDPVNPQEAATKAYADAGSIGSHAKTHFNGSGDEIDLARLMPSGDVDINGYKIIGSDMPVASGDLANKQYVDNSAGGSGSPWRYIPIPAGAWDYPSIGGGAPLDNDAGDDGDSKRHLFDDTVKEYVVSPLIEIPDDFDTSGTVWFYSTGMAVTASAGKKVMFGIAHSARASGEDWDVPYVSGDMGIQTTPTLQGAYHRFAFSSGAAALDWQPGDQLRLKQYRNPEHASDDLSGDYGFNGLMIKIPRA